MRFALCILLLLGWCLLAMSVQAAPAVILTDQQPATTVKAHLDFLRDPEGKLSVLEVVSPAFAGQFAHTGEAGLTDRLTYDTYWLRVCLDNQSSPFQHWYLQVLETGESPVAVYLQSGNAPPLPLKPEPYFLYHTYPLNLPAQGQYTLYIRLLDHADWLGGALRFAQAEQRVNLNKVIFFTFVSGGWLALGLYNLFLFAGLRHASYGWLSLAILGSILQLNRLTGLLHQYFPVWPEYHQAYSAAAFLFLIGFTAFFRELLSIRKYLPRFDKVVQGLFWLAVVSLLTTAWLPFAEVWATLLILLGAIFSIGSILYLYSLRLPFNRKLAWAIGVLVIGGMPSILSGLAMPVGLVRGHEIELVFVLLFLFFLLLSLAQADHMHQLRAQAVSADAANKAKGVFLTTMSHELRTPMNAVVGAGILLRDSGLTPQQRRYVDKLDIAARHMLGLIGNILDVARIEQQALALERIPFDLKVLARELETLCAGQAANKGLAFSIQSPENALWLLGDPVRLKQILLNLLGNALKFTGHGSVQCTIVAGQAENGGIPVVFSVADTGIGIAQEQQVHLFQPFAQADSSTSRRYGGSGLGLAISSQLVTQMGGELCLESSLGQGSRFWFRLSFSPAEAVSVRQPSAESTPRLSTARILLVDDDEINQFFVEELLKRYGVAAVTVAGNGLQAIQRVREQPFDLVFMDVSMPEMDGYETARHIRTFKAAAELPIIALTAHAIAGERERCLAAGMDDFLTKPFATAALQDMLRRWLH